MSLLEVLRLASAILAAAQLLVMASRWRAWPTLRRPQRWLFLGIAGQAAAFVYGTCEVVVQQTAPGPRSYFNVVVQLWLLFGVLAYLPRGSRIRSRLRCWRGRHSPQEAP